MGLLGVFPSLFFPQMLTLHLNAAYLSVTIENLICCHVLDFLPNIEFIFLCGKC